MRDEPLRTFAWEATTATATKTSFKKGISATANFIARIQTRVGKFFSFGKDCIKVQEKRKKVVVLCSRPRQNVELGTFTLQSCSCGKEMYKKSDARSESLFCQSKPIAFLPLALPLQSSLLKLPIYECNQ